MVSADEAQYRVFRVRRTIHQLLRDRGYMIDQADIDMSEEDFKAGYTGEREALTIQVQKRDDPTDQIFVFWPSDPKVGVKPIKRCACRLTRGLRPSDESALAGRPPQPRSLPPTAPSLDANTDLGLAGSVHGVQIPVPAPARRYMDRMNEDEVKRAILVVQQNLTAFAKQATLPRRWGTARTRNPTIGLSRLGARLQLCRGGWELVSLVAARERSGTLSGTLGTLASALSSRQCDAFGALCLRVASGPRRRRKPSPRFARGSGVGAGGTGGTGGAGGTGGTGGTGETVARQPHSRHP